MQQIQGKSNRWSLCLSLSQLLGRPSKEIQTCCRSYWYQLAACGVEIFSKSTVAQTKMGHVSKTIPLLGDLSSLWLDIVSLCTKFESSSFSHSWDMAGAPKISNVSRDVTTPLSGTVCSPSAGTIYDQSVHKIWSLHVNSLRTHKRRRKMQKSGCFGGLGVTQGHRKHRHLIERIWLSIQL